MSNERMTPTQALEQSALDEAYRAALAAGFERLAREALHSDKDDATLTADFKHEFDALVKAYGIAAGVMGV